MLGGPMWRSLHTTLFRSCHYGVVVKCYASGQCGPSLIPGWCRSWSRRLQSNQPKKISSSKNIFRFQLLKFKLGNQNKIIVTLTSNKLLEWSCAIDSLFLIDRNQLLLCFSRTYLLFIDNNSWSSLVSWPTRHQHKRWRHSWRRHYFLLV